LYEVIVSLFESMKEESIRLVAIKELSDLLSLKVTKLRDLAKRRLIPCVKLGHRTVRYEPNKVVEAIRRLEQQAH